MNISKTATSQQTIHIQQQRYIKCLHTGNWVTGTAVICNSAMGRPWKSYCPCPVGQNPRLGPIFGFGRVVTCSFSAGLSIGSALFLIQGTFKYKAIFRNATPLSHPYTKGRCNLSFINDRGRIILTENRPHLVKSPWGALCKTESFLVEERLPLH